MASRYENFQGFKSEDVDLSILLDRQGRQRTRSLFAEAIQSSVKEKGELVPLYTLKNRDDKGLPSAYLIYMSSIDEFDAALKLVGTLTHWRKLCDAKWFLSGENGLDGLEQWRLDMAMRDQSMAKAQLIKTCGKGDSSSARKLLDMSKTDTKRPIGRPATKADKAAQDRADKDAADQAEIERLHSESGVTNGQTN